jgi:hypothetical protein
MREIDGILYANDGDWVESLSALVEHHDGRLELLDWQNAGSTITWQVPDQFATPDVANTQIGAGA